MKINYNIDPALLVDEVEGPKVIAMMKEARVDTIWLWGYFYGSTWSSLETIAEAGRIARSHGFEAAIIQLPVGHPGNSLNPDDDAIRLKIPDHWRYREDSAGKPKYYIGDIEPVMVRENVESIVALRDAGFTRFMMDDDLRLGELGDEIQGCFCDICVSEFGRASGRTLTRESLVQALQDKADTVLMKEWVGYNCSKVTNMMKEMNVPGVELGIMVMHLGDERHGIDMREIQEAIPGCEFRVGELHFSDGEFGSPEGKASELLGIQYHLNLVGRERTVSETTVFPPKSLNENNLICKVKIAVSAGISDIYFMSGTWLIEESYWNAWSRQYPAIRQIAEWCDPYERAYPVHLAKGTHGAYGEAVEPPLLPYYAGLPVKPVRGNEPDTSGEVLLFFGDYHIGAEWKACFPLYKTVIVDSKAAERNKDVLGKLPANVKIWSHEAGTLPAETEVALLRSELEACEAIASGFPRLTEGTNLALVSLPDRNSVIVMNLEEHSNAGRLKLGDHQTSIELPALGFALVDERDGQFNVHLF
ncbi:hypothetical protein [Cohnella soli]|uniref:Beta-galactosidase trimerisation domain-containing protein n=1 Tax=Cohnella soli TaxID=425005 RepID=A0ABW0HP51_9BACL